MENLINSLNVQPTATGTWYEVLLSLAFTLLLSGVMYYTFKKTHSEITYDNKYNIMLVMLAIVSTIIMQLIRSNLALSLGMLGSLSLVRFRTNVKDPRDIGFVFWAMSIGISSSSQGYLIGIIGSIFLAVFMIVTGDDAKKSGSMLLVVRGNESDFRHLGEVINIYTTTNRLKAQNLLADSYELVYEIKAEETRQADLAYHLQKVYGVDTVNILAPNAEMV